MEYIKCFLKSKNAAFFVALGVALFSLVVGIVYGATWIKGYESFATFLLYILGALLFVAVSFYSVKCAAAVMTACNLIGFACFLLATYDIVFSKAISGLNLADPDVKKVITFAVLMILATAAANVFVWLDTSKKTLPTKKENTTND